MSELSSWVKYFKDGIPYYHNESSGESKWNIDTPSAPSNSEVEMGTDVIRSQDNSKEVPTKPVAANTKMRPKVNTHVKFLKKHIGPIISMVSIFMNIIVLSIVLGDVKSQMSELKGGITTMENVFSGSLSAIKNIGELQGQILSQTSTVESIKNTSTDIQRELNIMYDDVSSALRSMLDVAPRSLDLLDKLNFTTRQINTYNGFITRVGEILPSNMKSISPSLDPLLTNGALYGYTGKMIQSITNLPQGCMCGYCGRLVTSTMDSATIINNNLMIHCENGVVYSGNITSGYMYAQAYDKSCVVRASVPTLLSDYFMFILNGVEAYNILNGTMVGTLLVNFPGRLFQLCEV